MEQEDSTYCSDDGEESDHKFGERVVILSQEAKERKKLANANGGNRSMKAHLLTFDPPFRRDSVSQDKQRTENEAVLAPSQHTTCFDESNRASFSSHCNQENKEELNVTVQPLDIALLDDKAGSSDPPTDQFTSHENLFKDCPDIFLTEPTATATEEEGIEVEHNLNLFEPTSVDPRFSSKKDPISEKMPMIEHILAAPGSFQAAIEAKDEKQQQQERKKVKFKVGNGGDEFILRKIRQFGYSRKKGERNKRDQSGPLSMIVGDRVGIHGR